MPDFIKARLSDMLRYVTICIYHTNFICVPGKSNANKFNLNISRKPCSSNGREGICVYNQECHRKKGEVLGTCLDGFIFGACCNLKEDQDKLDVEDQTESSSKETDPLGILLKIDKLLGSWNKSGN